MKIIGILLLFIAIMEVMFGSMDYLLASSLAVLGLAFILKRRSNS